jgi:heparan-alpha-glucosaminide N-acetyltransferase
MWQLMGPFIKTNLKRHVTPDLFDIFGPAYAPLLERAFVLIILWLIILWMYRRKIFLRI